MVLMIAGTVCVVILATTISVIVAQFVASTDSAGAASAIGDIVNTMIGLLAGFLAGRSESALTSTGKTPEQEGKEPPS